MVLVGGGANMKKLAEYSKKSLELASQIGKIDIESTISEDVKKPEFAAAVGLMLEGLHYTPEENKRESTHEGFFARLFKRNK